jgi:hypothetical protein
MVAYPDRSRPLFDFPVSRENKALSNPWPRSFFTPAPSKKKKKKDKKEEKQSKSESKKEVDEEGKNLPVFDPGNDSNPYPTEQDIITAIQLSQIMDEQSQFRTFPQTLQKGIEQTFSTGILGPKQEYKPVARFAQPMLSHTQTLAGPQIGSERASNESSGFGGRMGLGGPKGGKAKGAIDRAKFRAELNNPAVRAQFEELMQAEVGPYGHQSRVGFAETVFNRAAITGQSISDVVFGRNKSRGYYQPINQGTINRTRRGMNQAKRSANSRAIDAALAGSNTTNGATHNASGGWGRRHIAKYGVPQSVVSMNGEMYYSKPHEQAKIASLISAPIPNAPLPTQNPVAVAQRAAANTPTMAQAVDGRLNFNQPVSTVDVASLAPADSRSWTQFTPAAQPQNQNVTPVMSTAVNPPDLAPPAPAPNPNRSAFQAAPLPTQAPTPPGFAPAPVPTANPNRASQEVGQQPTFAPQVAQQNAARNVEVDVFNTLNEALSAHGYATKSKAEPTRVSVHPTPLGMQAAFDLEANHGVRGALSRAEAISTYSNNPNQTGFGINGAELGTQGRVGVEGLNSVMSGNQQVGVEGLNGLMGFDPANATASVSMDGLNGLSGSGLSAGLDLGEMGGPVSDGFDFGGLGFGSGQATDAMGAEGLSSAADFGEQDAASLDGLSGAIGGDLGGFGSGNSASTSGVGGASVGQADDTGTSSIGAEGGLGGVDSDAASGAEGSDGDCVIATANMATGRMSRADRARAIRLCKQKLHGHWIGETVRLGYRKWGRSQIAKGRARDYADEFNRCVLQKTWADTINLYARWSQFFCIGVIERLKGNDE